MKTLHKILTLVTLCTVLPTLASADSNADVNKRHRACLNKVEVNAEAAFDDAIAWEGLGGGEAAKHCAAAALLAANMPLEAARRFEALADSTRRDDVFRADILAHAARAYLVAGDDARALEVLDTAIRLNPAKSDFHLDRAEVLAAQGAYWEAIDDLNLAIAGTPNSADGFALRASAYRMLETFDLARADADRALEINPKHVPALLESGIIARLSGNDVRARKDWVTLLLVDPLGPAAVAARANLERLDGATQ